MEGNDIGIRDAIAKAAELRELIGAADITVHWPTEFGDVMLIVDEDGHDLFVNDEHVPMNEAG